MHKKLWFQESRGGLSKTHQATVSSSRSIPTCSRKSPHEWKWNGGNLGYPLIGGELRQESLELVKWRLVGGIPTPLKNDGVRQWEGWQPIYMKWKKKCWKPPSPGDFLMSESGGSPNQQVSIRHDIHWILGGWRGCPGSFLKHHSGAYNLTTGTGYPVGIRQPQKVQRHAKPHGKL